MSLHGGERRSPLAHLVDVRATPPYGAFTDGGRQLYATRSELETVVRAFGAGRSPLLSGQPLAGRSSSPPRREVALEAR